MLRIDVVTQPSKVTEDPIHYASRGKAPKAADTMIHVQPLKKSEMQVCVLSLEVFNSLSFCVFFASPPMLRTLEQLMSFMEFTAP